MPKPDRTVGITVILKIRVLRGQRIILDTDLAELYGVSVKRLNEQVKRNRERFPDDFMFRVTKAEETFLRSQIATSKSTRGGRRYRPNAFTEHGAIMAATVLNSKRAVRMSLFVVRTFVQLRDMLTGQSELAAKVRELEVHLESHDESILDLIAAIKQLANPARRRRAKIGFQLPEGSTARAEQPKFYALRPARQLTSG
jgi:hypothetical protein